MRITAPAPPRRKLTRPQGKVETMSLRDLRAEVGRSQVEVSEAMGTDQGELSRIERRGGHRTSTLRRYVEALGGKVEVFAVFPGRRVKLEGV